METKNIETVIDLAASQADPRVANAEAEIPFITVPNTYRAEDLEHLLPFPTRKRARVSLTDADSFIAYIKKHGSLGECVIYTDLDTESSKINLEAVINDHAADSAQWRDFRATFNPKLSVEWRRWKSNDRQEMSQINFAAFLEDNIGDIVSVNGSPAGADMLQMALAFERTADKKLASRVNLQSGGVRFEYIDDDNKGTRSAMEAFNRFHIGVPVFYNSQSAYPVEARLKYREKEGKVVFWYELVRADKIFNQAAQEVLDKVKAQTGFMMLFGAP